MPSYLPADTWRYTGNTTGAYYWCYFHWWLRTLKLEQTCPKFFRHHEWIMRTMCRWCTTSNAKCSVNHRMTIIIGMFPAHLSGCHVDFTMWSSHCRVCTIWSVYVVGCESRWTASNRHRPMMSTLWCRLCVHWTGEHKRTRSSSRLSLRSIWFSGSRGASRPVHVTKARWIGRQCSNPNLVAPNLCPSVHKCVRLVKNKTTSNSINRLK